MRALLILLIAWPCLAATTADDSTATKSPGQKIKVEQVPSVSDSSRVEQDKSRVLKKEKRAKEAIKLKDAAIVVGAIVLVGAVVAGLVLTVVVFTVF